MSGLSGMDRLLSNLRRLEREAPEALGRAVRDVAFDVQGRATEKAPVDTGHLRESAYTEIDEHAGGITATVGFTATTKDGRFSYALVQHEGLDFEHPKGGEAKFLEKALDEVADDFTDRLAGGVDRFVRDRLT